MNPHDIHPANVLLPVGPLTEALRVAGGFPSRDLPHVSRLSRAYQRAVNRGTISAVHADEICVRILERHPTGVYGHSWLEPDGCRVS